MMNRTKLSAMLLIASVGLVYAQEPKKEADKPVVQQAPNFYESGKECGTLLVTAMKSNDEAGQMAYVQKANSILGPVGEVLQKGDTTSAEAKAAWKNLQDFNRGLKEVFEKDTPKAPANLSSIEKQGFDLGIEATKMSYDLVLSSSDFVAYNKAMQENKKVMQAKMQDLMAKYQQQMAENAPQPKPAEAAK